MIAESDNELAEAFAELQEAHADLGRAFTQRTENLAAIGLTLTDSGKPIYFDRDKAVAGHATLMAEFEAA